MGTKIKDAQLLENLTGNESIPISDGSGNPKRVLANQLKNIPVVDSEDKLDSLGLKQGELAAITVNELRAVSFGELYQPSEWFNVNFKPSDFDKFSSVTKIECYANSEIKPGAYSAVGIVPKKIFEGDMNPYGLFVSEENGATVVAFADLTTNSVSLLVKNGEVDTLAVKSCNDILNSKEFVYTGPLDSFDANIMDLGVKLIKEVSGSILNIKEKNSFGKIVKEEELTIGLSRIEGLAKKTLQQYELLEFNNAGGSHLSIFISTAYTILKHNALDVLVSITNEENRCFLETTIEYHCYGAELRFQDDSITWENGTSPDFTKNSIILITVINRLASYKVFPMKT